MNVALYEWQVGVERETSPGVYATCSALIMNWTLWRFETANGVHLVAGKPAQGGRLLIPLGVAQALWGSTPSIRVDIRDTVQAFISAAHHHVVKAEMRFEGERFVKPVPVPFDPMPHDGKRLEVYLSSMPGPRSFSKVRREQGLIDLSGLSEIVAAGRGLLRN